MCNRTDCAGVFVGELACRVCEEGEMGEMELTDAELARLEDLKSGAPYTGANKNAVTALVAEVRRLRAEVMNNSKTVWRTKGDFLEREVVSTRAENAALRDRVEALEKTQRHLEETARVLAEQVGKGNLGKVLDALDWADRTATEREAIS